MPYLRNSASARMSAEPLNRSLFQARSLVTEMNLASRNQASAGSALSPFRRRRNATGRISLPSAFPRDSIRSDNRVAGRGARRDLARPSASGERIRAEQRRFWRRRARSNGTACRSSGRAGPCGATRAAGHLRPRSSRYAAPPRARRSRCGARCGDRPCLSAFGRRRTRIRCLPPARRPLLGSVRHDRRRTWLPARAVAAGARARARQTGQRSRRSGRQHRVGFRAQARVGPVRKGRLPLHTPRGRGRPIHDLSRSRATLSTSPRPIILALKRWRRRSPDLSSP